MGTLTGLVRPQGTLALSRVGFEKNGMDQGQPLDGQTDRLTDTQTNFVKLSYGFAKTHEGHMQLPLAKIYIRHNNQH